MTRQNLAQDHQSQSQREHDDVDGHKHILAQNLCVGAAGLHRHHTAQPALAPVGGLAFRKALSLDCLA